MDTRETKCKCPNKHIQCGTLNTNNTNNSEMRGNISSDGHYNAKKPDKIV